MQIQGDIIVNLDSFKTAKIMYEALNPEVKSAPSYRSKSSIFLEKSKIIITVNANDLTSFRAAVNSYLRLIHVISEVLSLT
ncbi:MAG: hypothetical protein DRJ39_00665 [Thermoprotei archaeon]|nr:hypothetical protein [Thermoproteales archaeon]RLE85970.1 MAG: hypothetical protein DRJ39_00665 [Thermoprotei archaeon]